MYINFKNQLEKSCHLYSDKVFIREASTEKTFSYKNFYNDTKRINSYITSCFLDKKIIVLSAKNSYLFSVYIMASILSGKTVLLINPEETPESFTKVLSQLNESYVLFADDFLRMSVDHQKMLPHSDHSPRSDHDFTDSSTYQDLIYIPTSATTGESKIVIQREDAILANIFSLIKHHQLTTKSSIATPLPLFHVNALHFSFFCTLFTGGTLTLFQYFDLKKTFQVIEKDKVEILSIIPSILSNIARNFDSIRNYDISSLKYFVSAAAPLSTDTVEKVDSLLNKKIIQGYGLSEVVNFSCTLPIDISDDLYRELMIQERYPSIGVALDNNDISVHNSEGETTQEGAEGEIYIKGLSVMPGYLNTPSQHYFHNGFFKTGDLGFFKTIKGKRYFFISGRIKETAKINGNTVSLRELDEKIQSSLKITNDTITTAFYNEFRGEEIAIVCQLGEADDVNFIFAQLKESFKSIDSNIAPRVILLSKSLSLRTPSGKAKRWIFKSYLQDFKNRRFLNSIELLVI